MEKATIPAKKRLEKTEVSLFSLSPQLFDLIDQWFNIPRILDRTYLKRLFQRKYRFGLDIGAGKGSMTEFLLKYVDKITCLDKEAKQLAVLKKRLGDKSQRLSFVKGDAGNLPFKNNSFDLIFSNCVLEHIKDDERVLAEISRCLQPGGWLIMTFPNKQMEAGWFKTLLFNQPRMRFLADPTIMKYFSFSNLKKAEEWYSSYRWQHVRRGYGLGETEKRLSRYHLKVEDSFYYPSKILSELWEIITFSLLNKLFPYILFLFVPFFYLLPKNIGNRRNSLEFAILAQKER